MLSAYWSSISEHMIHRSDELHLRSIKHDVASVSVLRMRDASYRTCESFERWAQLQRLHWHSNVRDVYNIN